VQACFDNEAELKAKFEGSSNAGTPTDDMTASPAMSGRRFLQPA
jgi:hypothetical protein